MSGRFPGPDEGLTERVVQRILDDGHVDELFYSGVNVMNAEAGFVNPTRLGLATSTASPLGVEQICTIVDWGRYGHPLLNIDFEVLYDESAKPPDWLRLRRTILGSSIGSVVFSSEAARAGEGQNEIDASKIDDICANANVPVSILQVSRVLSAAGGLEMPHLAILWHPTGMDANIALAGLQSAVALAIDMEE